MRPRILLFLFGLLTSLLSILALFKNAIRPTILGSAIGEKIEILPSSPTLYFVLILLIGLMAVILSIIQRKVIY